MDIYASDDEKGEEIKQWWRDNGRSVVVGSIVAIAILFSGRYWFDHKNAQSVKASVAYQHVVSALSDDQQSDAAKVTEQLFSEYSDSPYAVFSAFEMASQSIRDNDADAAETYLKWVISHAKLSAHKELAKFRLAQVLMIKSEFDRALSLVEENQPSDAFTSLWAELKGDIYIAQSKPNEAKTAYQLAISKLTQGEPRQQLLQIKLDDLVTSTNG